MSEPVEIPGVVYDLRCLAEQAKAMGAVFVPSARKYKGWGGTLKECDAGVIRHPRCRFEIGVFASEKTGKSRTWSLKTDLHNGEVEKLFGKGLSTVMQGTSLRYLRKLVPRASIRNLKKTRDGRMVGAMLV